VPYAPFCSSVFNVANDTGRQAKTSVASDFPGALDFNRLAGSSDPFTFKPNPSVWGLRFLEINQIVFLILGLIGIFYFKGARFFVAVFFMINLYFMVAMTALSTMGVRGTWI
jgi:hypothetical protein